MGIEIKNKIGQKLPRSRQKKIKKKNITTVETEIRQLLDHCWYPAWTYNLHLDAFLDKTSIHLHFGVNKLSCVVAVQALLLFTLKGLSVASSEAGCRKWEDTIWDVAILYRLYLHLAKIQPPPDVVCSIQASLFTTHSGYIYRWINRLLHFP